MTAGGAVPRSSTREAFCIRCLCTESRACVGGCSWRYFNDRHRIGICSSCTTYRNAGVHRERQERRGELKDAVDRYIKSAKQGVDSFLNGPDK